MTQNLFRSKNTSFVLTSTTNSKRVLSFCVWTVLLCMIFSFIHYAANVKMSSCLLLFWLSSIVQFTYSLGFSVHASDYRHLREPHSFPVMIVAAVTGCGRVSMRSWCPFLRLYLQEWNNWDKSQNHFCCFDIYFVVNDNLASLHAFVYHFIDTILFLLGFKSSS